MQNSVDIEQENRRLRKVIADKDHHIKILEDYVLSLKLQQFGSSIEKLSPTQPELFDDADGDTAGIGADNVAAIKS